LSLLNVMMLILAYFL